MKENIKQPWDNINDPALADCFRFGYGWRNKKPTDKEKENDIKYLIDNWGLDLNVVIEYLDKGYNNIPDSLS